MQKYYRRTTELSRTEYLENRREGVKTNLSEITLETARLSGKIVMLKLSGTSQLKCFVQVYSFDLK